MQYRFGIFVLDTAQFALYNDGEKVELEPQVLKLLEYLVENRDRVVSRNEILDKVFGRRIVTDNALTVRVRAARQAVGRFREKAIGYRDDPGRRLPVCRRR